MKNSTSHFIAFLAGAAAGAVVGVLYAPDKGSNTRDKLSYKLHKYKDKLEEITNDLIKGKDIPASEARTEGEKLIDDARIKAERLLSDVDNLINQIRKQR